MLKTYPWERSVEGSTVSSTCAPHAAKAAGQVVDPHPEDERGRRASRSGSAAGAAGASRRSRRRPRSASRARGRCARGGEQRRQVARVVREVGVHHDHVTPRRAPARGGSRPGRPCRGPPCPAGAATSTLGSSAASRSASSPVPSGEASSTTSSAPVCRARCARAARPWRGRPPRGCRPRCRWGGRPRGGRALRETIRVTPDPLSRAPAELSASVSRRDGAGVPTERPLHILVLADRDWTHHDTGGNGANIEAQVSRWVRWGNRVTVVAGSYPGAKRGRALRPPADGAPRGQPGHRVPARLPDGACAAWAGTPTWSSR